MSTKSSQPERRKSRRRPILETFSLFIVVPRKGMHRLEIHDVSDAGMGFNIDIEGESPSDYPLQPGDAVDIRLYLNQTLYLPLNLEVVRVDGEGRARKVGAQFRNLKDPGFQGYQAFLRMLDVIADVAQRDSAPSG